MQILNLLQQEQEILLIHILRIKENKKIIILSKEYYNFYTLLD